MSTPENVRFHAAGHLAAAHELARIGEVSASRHILGMIAEYMKRPNVDSPPQMRASLDEYIKFPQSNLDNIKAFEAMFIADENTMLEQGGIRLGKG